MRASVSLSVLGCLVLVACSTPDPGNDFVENQWNTSIRRLGADVQSVYPPTEDIQMGDVYAIEGSIDGTGNAGRSLKIGYVDEINTVAEALYQKRLMLPLSKFGTDGKVIDRSKDQAADASSPFRGRFKRSLPIVAFPEYGLASGRLFNFSASLPGQIFGLLFGFGLAENTDLRVSVSDNNTYGIPAYDAQYLLRKFCGRVDDPCSQANMNSAFTATYGRKPKTRLWVRMLSRVYVTRTINYTYTFRSAAAARVVSARLDSMQAFADKATSLVTPTAEDANSNKPSSARDVLLKQMLDGLQGDISALAANKGGNAFGLTAQSYTGNSIGLSQSFTRPLTFAYGGVWWDDYKVVPGSRAGTSRALPSNNVSAHPISPAIPQQAAPGLPPINPAVTPQVVLPQMQM